MKIMTVNSTDTPCRDGNAWFTRNHKEIHRNKYISSLKTALSYTVYTGFKSIVVILTLLSFHGVS